MLNLSEERMPGESFFSRFEATDILRRNKHYTVFFRILVGFSIAVLIVLFLPWTQTIRGKGYITTVDPAKRPQTLQSPIPGQVEKWYVGEGDYVSTGDTILRIAEVQTEYFDPQLLTRTRNQIKAKESSLQSYNQKINAYESQLEALQRERNLKLEQARNKRRMAILKIQSDSIYSEASRTNAILAQRQLDRSEILTAEGLRSTFEVEKRKSKQQNKEAKAIENQNKLLGSRNELLNAIMEINRLGAEYENKISTIRSKISEAESARFSVMAEISKLENQLSNYERRRGFYYVRAPQDSYINKAIITGVGETFKSGQNLVNLVPAHADLAVETYVDPVDLPLLENGDEVQIKFDGWPSIVFSGWPSASVGTFGGRIIAIQNFMSPNGKYRVLVRPAANRFNDHWPKALRVGSGAQTMTLLDDVPIWYEIWRKLNGFPPNYYHPNQNNKKIENGQADSKKSPEKK